MSSLRELRSKKATPVWSRVVGATRDPNLMAIVFFCAIGLLITVNLILRFPDLGVLIAQYTILILVSFPGFPASKPSRVLGRTMAGSP